MLQLSPTYRPGSWPLQINRYCYFLLICSMICAIISPIHAQKLPGIRVDQETVSEESLFIEANRARLLGDYDVAETKLNTLIDTYGDKAVFHYEMSRLYQEIGELDEAWSAIVKANEIESDNEWYWQYRANLAEEREDEPAVISSYRQLSEMFPERQYYLENIAFHQLKNEDPDGALKTLNTLEKKAGVNFETTRQKHLIYHEKGQSAKAADELAKYIAIYPDDARMIRIAASYALNCDDKNLARAYYRSLLSIDPNDGQAQGALLKMDAANSPQSDKLARFIANPEIDLDQKILQLIPVLTDFQNGNGDISAEELEALGQSLLDQYGAGDKTQALLGDIYSLQNKLNIAADFYIKSINFNDGNYTVWEQLLYVLADIPVKADLLTYSEEAMDIYPNKAMPYAFHALALAHNQQFESAAQLLKQARIVSGQKIELNAQIDELEKRIEQLKAQ